MDDASALEDESSADVNNTTAKEGNRMRNLRNVIDKSIQKYIGNLRLMKQVPGVSKDILKHLHDDIIKQLDSNIRSELEQMYQEEDIESLLNGLDQLTDACPRTGPPAWRPSGDPETDRHTHMASLKRLKLQVLQKQLAELEAQNQMLARNVVKKEKQLLQTQGQVKTVADDLQQVVEDEATGVTTLINAQEG